MKANELKKLLNEWNISLTVYDDVKYYLRANGWKLADITHVSKWNDFHVVLEVNGHRIGVI